MLEVTIFKTVGCWAQQCVSRGNVALIFCQKLTTVFLSRRSVSEQNQRKKVKIVART